MSLFQPLSEDHLIELRELGFIHITGLIATEGLGAAYREGRPIEVTLDDEHGRYCTNNGVTVIVTVDGQVWLGAPLHDKAAQFKSLVGELCPKGGNAPNLFVPCSNGESIHISMLLKRTADPYEASERTVRRQFIQSV